MHRAVAAKHHGHVRQIVGLQRVAAKHVDPCVAEGLHNVRFHIRMGYGCGSHGEIVPPRGTLERKFENCSRTGHTHQVSILGQRA